MEKGAQESQQGVNERVVDHFHEQSRKLYGLIALLCICRHNTGGCQSRRSELTSYGKFERERRLYRAERKVRLVFG